MCAGLSHVSEITLLLSPMYPERDSNLNSKMGTVIILLDPEWSRDSDETTRVKVPREPEKHFCSYTRPRPSALRTSGNTCGFNPGWRLQRDPPHCLQGGSWLGFQSRLASPGPLSRCLSAGVLQGASRLPGDPEQPGQPDAGAAGGAGAAPADRAGACHHGLLPGGVPRRQRVGGGPSHGPV